MFNRGTPSNNAPPELQSLLQEAPTDASPLPAEPTTPLAPVGLFTGIAPVPKPTTGQLSIIGANLVILGEKITIITQDRLQIDGEVRGDISAQSVVIGQTGKVAGTVAANTVEVHGHVVGAVKAHHVTLHPTAHVDGDIYNHVLKIAEGAVFDGRVRRPKDPSELIPNLDIASIASARAE